MFALLMTVVLVVFLFFVAIWILGKIAPGHPAMVDNVLWVVCLVCVLVIVANALGVSDVPLPRLWRH